MKSWPELISGSIYVRKSKYQYSWFSRFNCDKQSTVHLCKGSEVANLHQRSKQPYASPGSWRPVRLRTRILKVTLKETLYVRKPLVLRAVMNAACTNRKQSRTSISSVVVHAPMYCLGNRTRSPITTREAQSTIIYNL